MQARNEGKRPRLSAATALWLWHDWKISGQLIGWYKSAIEAEIRELQGFGRTQADGRHADPTATASKAFDIALTVDRILQELPEGDAERLILRKVRRMTFAEIADHFGHERKQASKDCRAAAERFYTLLDARAGV